MIIANYWGSWSLKVFAAVLFSSLWCSVALAAVPAARPYLSPEIHADHTVTFRIMAPDAKNVAVEGGWTYPAQPIPMSKDEMGLWSLTVGPLPSNIFAYWFHVDGAIVTDEANESIRVRTGGSSVSNLEIPGSDLPWSLRDVPHGIVEQRLMKSKTYGGESRAVSVYLPPGYDKDARRRYPVLYLFHGAGETELSWVNSGKANLILDNLLANKKMLPAIVVMPYTGPAADARARPGRNPAAPPLGGSPVPGTGPNGPGLSQQFVLDELIAWTQANFRILPGRENHALAGFSAGGSLATGVAFSDLKDFSQLGIFSAPIRSMDAYPALKNAAVVNANLNVFWIGVGNVDPLATAGLRKADTDLSQAGIHHSYQETEGAHDFSVWRWCLSQYAPLLFKGTH
jgi:enterochelin esterase-like enzyme